MVMRRRGLWLALATMVLLGAWLYLRPREAAPVRIGVLHSLTGTMAASEKPVVDALRLAVEQINARGGLLGQRLEIVLADGRSSPASFASAAEQLSSRQHVVALFGCWTSASRKAVLPVIERHKHLLLYPVQYEGLEQSPYILYAGAAPNQQIIPGTRWAMSQFGKRVYLIGSDYVFPRAANRIIRDVIDGANGSVVGESYVPLGGDRFDAIAADIARLRPDVVLNTINGSSNRHLLRALESAGLANQPLLSFSLSEAELQEMGAARLHAHYLAWNYLHDLPLDDNEAFVAAFRQRFGAGRRISDPMETAYTAVHLWAQAVSEAGSFEPAKVTFALRQQSYNSPAGIISVDPDNQHLWKPIYIARILPDGRLGIVHAVRHAVRPNPFPEFRTRSEWLTLLNNAIEQRQP